MSIDSLLLVKFGRVPCITESSFAIYLFGNFDILSLCIYFLNIISPDVVFPPEWV